MNGKPIAETRIEPVGPDQAPLVHRLTAAAFAEYQGRLEPPTGAQSESIDDVIKQIRSGGAAIAWLSDEAVGAVRYRPVDDHLYVGRLAVLPAYRRFGKGSQLIGAAEAYALTTGLQSVQVEVRSALPGNIAFFERLGFVQIAVQPHPRDPRATSVRLEKRLFSPGEDRLPSSQPSVE